MRVEKVDAGCSGMAGTFGMRYDGFERSMLAGAPLLNRISMPDFQYAVTQCGACRMQIEQGAGKRTLHPAEWLALSYGFARNPDSLLERPKFGLVGR
jgi:Fe-S oxidoreductase